MVSLVTHGIKEPRRSSPRVPTEGFVTQPKEAAHVSTATVRRIATFCARCASSSIDRYLFESGTEGTVCNLRRILSITDRFNPVKSIVVSPLTYKGDAVLIEAVKDASPEFNLIVAVSHAEPVRNPL